MNELEMFLKTVVDGMKSMARAIEVLAGKLDTIAKSQKHEKAKAKPVRKAQAKPKKKPVAKKEKPTTAVDTVFAIIKRSKKGVDTAILVEKTGYGKKKIADLVYKLKKQGKIKSVGKGVYLKA